MENPVAMNNDSRAIKEIALTGDSGDYWNVGRSGVTRIVPYLENNQVWFAVYEGDWLSVRVNAALVESVWYGKAPEAE